MYFSKSGVITMDYGVVISKGAQPWQIFQQDEQGKAGFSIEGRYSRARLSSSVPIHFSYIHGGQVTVKARIAVEDTGDSLIDWQPCDVRDDGTWKTHFDSVPAGGLYRIETYMEYEGWDGLSVTRGDMVHHIGVGDIFLIAGQSNAAGRSKNPVYDPPQLGIHMLRSSGRWDLAAHPLNETTDALYLGHFENHNPGHSPWLHFAKRLHKDLGYPIGLVNAAYGGAPLSWWNPDENGALLDNAMALLSSAGGRVKAVLWYQGEAEGYEQSADSYGERFAVFIRHLRQRLGQSLPMISVQLNRCMENPGELVNRQWGLIREAQRKLPETIPDLYVVPSSDTSLYDFIHISSEGNLIIGERCAKAALCEIYGRQINYKGCEVDQAKRLEDGRVQLHFANVVNWLNTFGLSAAQLPFEAEDARGLHKPINQEIGRDTLTLRFEHALEAGAVIHGAWRMDLDGMPPWDCMRMPMLSFYGLKVE